MSFFKFNFSYTYTDLPSCFFFNQFPTPVSDPKLAVFNRNLANELGLKDDDYSPSDFIGLLSGNDIPSTITPIAQAYAGHQFGHLTMLGDGRAVLLAELVKPNGVRMDLQLKGSGRTPFSRNGDGRAALGPMLREFLISEAMHALGIPTTRSLAVVLTGESVYRESELPGAILTRIASSHIRVGTFEFAALQEDVSIVKALADYTIQRHYPLCFSSENPYQAFLTSVIDAQASLVAKWLCVGFVHGVMNTDNVSIAGETIDYGPCAFLDGYHEKAVFSSIDQQGRYAYGNQPFIMNWNLARFAETLLPLLGDTTDQALDFANEAIASFMPIFKSYWLSGMRSKLGLIRLFDEDAMLISEFLDLLQMENRDYTHSFLDIATPLSDQYSGKMKEWHLRYLDRLEKEHLSLEEIFEKMAGVNPVIIPRNYHVEMALEHVLRSHDYDYFMDLLAVLQNPYDRSHHDSIFYEPGRFDYPYRTFCGT